MPKLPERGARVPLINVPKYIFLGDPIPAEGKEIVAAALNTHLLEPHPHPDLPELPITQERREQLTAVLSAKADYARSLGVDISETLPTPDQFHFYDEAAADEYRRREVNDLWRGENFYSRHSDIEERDIANTLYDSDHEVGHAAQSRRVTVEIVPRVDEDGNETGVADLNVTRVSHAAYRVSDSRPATEDRHQARSFFSLDEVAIEMATRDTVTECWPNYPQLADLHPEFDGHGDKVDTFDQVFTEAAERQQMDPTQLRQDIERGQMIGDRTALRILANTYGTDGMREIAHFDPSPTDAADNLLSSLQRSAEITAQAQPARDELVASIKNWSGQNERLNEVEQEYGTVSDQASAVREEVEAAHRAMTAARDNYSNIRRDLEESIDPGNHPDHDDPDPSGTTGNRKNDPSQPGGPNHVKEPADQATVDQSTQPAPEPVPEQHDDPDAATGPSKSDPQQIVPPAQQPTPDISAEQGHIPDSEQPEYQPAQQQQAAPEDPEPETETKEEFSFRDTSDQSIVSDTTRTAVAEAAAASEEPSVPSTEPAFEPDHNEPVVEEYELSMEPSV